MQHRELLKSFLLLTNFLCFVTSFLSLFIILNRWNEYLGNIVAILIAISGLLVYCQFEPGFLKLFGLASILDGVFITTNAILLTILAIRWDKFCKGETTIEDDNQDLSCYNLREYGYWTRIIASIILFYITLVCRIGTAAASFSLSNHYQNQYKKRRNAYQ